MRLLRKALNAVSGTSIHVFSYFKSGIFFSSCQDGSVGRKGSPLHSNNKITTKI